MPETAREDPGPLALVNTDRPEISVCEAWQRQCDPVRGPGFRSAASWPGDVLGLGPAAGQDMALGPGRGARQT